MAYAPKLGFLGLVVLAGCASDPSSPPAAPVDVSIDATNALRVASSVWLAQTATRASDIVPDEVGEARDRYLPYLAYRPNTRSLEVPCRLGGTVVLDGSVDDPGRPGATAGDVVVAAYHDCKTPLVGTLDQTRNGTLSVIVDAIDAQGTTLVATFDGLTTRLGSFGTFRRDGTASIAQSADGRSTTMRSDRLTVMSDGVVHVLEGYETHLVDEGESFTSAYSLDFHGVEQSSEIGGRATFSTPVTFQGVGDARPTAGELRIDGAEGTSVRLVADPDGVHASLVLADGTTLPTTWDALEE